MKRRSTITLGLLMAGAILTNAQAQQPVPARWYNNEQIAWGEKVYTKNCQVCHGKEGIGTFNWKQRTPDGKLPPPPLNGSAHTWHHPLPILYRIIMNGTAQQGGTMPGWKETLSRDDVVAVIAWFQSKWSDKIYTDWYQRNQQAMNAKKR